MEFYKSKSFDRKKPGKYAKRDSDTFRSFRNSRDDSRESTTVTCADCSTECTVPFVPRTDKPVYCSDCFRKHKPDDSRDDRGGSSRYSNNDRGGGSSRYSSNDRYSNNDRGSSRYSRDDRGSSRYSRDDRGSSNDRYSRDDRGSSRYSRDDRSSNNDRYSRDDRGSRNDRYSNNDRESTTVTCADCSVECTVPFVPRTNKPVYCSDCFRTHKPDDSRDDRGGSSRYSRDDRGSRNDRYSNNNNDNRSSRSSYDREPRRDSSRTRNQKSDKFLKKREGFLSNGSDKFYETIKEKLFEILGGKTCASCGFKDERALGISPTHENISFDTNGRGGEASSWGKYISSPDLAREELKVLCLNCNEIREPVTKPATTETSTSTSSSKPKKSRYFPR